MVQTSLPSILFCGFPPSAFDVPPAPVLMLGGRYDFVKPLATLQQPLFRLLGTGESDKRFIQFDSGHVPPLGDWMRETLNWLDHYLRPVTSNAVVNR